MQLSTWEKEDKRALNFVYIHLASLYAIFEEGLSLSVVPKLRGRFSQFYKGKGLLDWLKPPESFGELTIFEFWNNEDAALHYEIADRWARSVWASWSNQHPRIAELVSKTRN